MSAQRKTIGDLLQGIDPADVTELPRNEQAAAVLKGTHDLHALGEGIVPLIIGQAGKSECESALAGTYYRMTLLLKGLSTLNDTCHFQLSQAGARTVFELLLDLKILVNNPSRATQFFAFPQVSRFHKAAQLADFLDKHGKIDPVRPQRAVQFAGDQQVRQRIEALCVRGWGTKTNGKPNWPEHWSGQSISERAKNAGADYEELYRTQFFIQSYFVHSGGAGVGGLSHDALVCLFCNAHLLVQRLFTEATEIIATEFLLFDAIPGLREKLQMAAAATGFHLTQAVLMASDSDRIDGERADGSLSARAS